MQTRRRFLGTVGAGVAVGMAGCSTRALPMIGHSRNEDGLQAEERATNDHIAAYNVDLGSNEWDAVSIEFPVPYREVDVVVNAKNGVLYGMAMTEDEFTRYYREDNSPRPEYQVAVADNRDWDVRQRDTVRITEAGTWYFVVDNTDYPEGHDPDGELVGFMDLIFVG